MNKYQEALEFLKEWAYENYLIKYIQTSQENVCLFKSAKALQELVDKATPKKAKLSNEQKIRYVQTYVCPTCGKEFTGGKLSNYCYRCGQALDWSNDNGN
ncbi:MAG: hypothetical protein MR283_00050 [Erysipelotrichaceae bacterium]|nr:hypothetical protein [Erysipelotrichaceae bacterium]